MYNVWPFVNIQTADYCNAKDGDNEICHHVNGLIQEIEGPFFAYRIHAHKNNFRLMFHVFGFADPLAT